MDNAESNKDPETINKKNKSENAANTETVKIQIDASSILPYDGLRAVFSFLSGRDLDNLMMVCRKWREAARCELNARKLSLKFGPTSTLFTNCKLKTHFHHSITNRPMLGLFLFSADDGPPDCISNHLPTSCTSVGIQNNGLVIEDKEYENIAKFCSYILLSKDADVYVDLIAYHPTEPKHHDENKYHPIFYNQKCGDPANNLKMAVQRFNKANCVIMFVRDDINYEELTIIPFNPETAIWGGAVQDLWIIDPKYKADLTSKPVWVGLVISGKHVKCWTTILHESDKSDVVIEQKLQQMKQELNLLKHTVGFMFSCVARGASWYDGRQNVESSIFKSIFPDIPLIGSFGNGEYGNCNFEVRDKTKKFENKVFHQYSTTFMILTYGLTKSKTEESE